MISRSINHDAAHDSRDPPSAPPADANSIEFHNSIQPTATLELKCQFLYPFRCYWASQCMRILLVKPTCLCLHRFVFCIHRTLWSDQMTCRLQHPLLSRPWWLQHRTLRRPLPTLFKVSTSTLLVVTSRKLLVFHL